MRERFRFSLFAFACVVACGNQGEPSGGQGGGAGQPAGAASVAGETHTGGTSGGTQTGGTTARAGTQMGGTTARAGSPADGGGATAGRDATNGGRAGAPAAGASGVSIQGRRLLVDGKPFRIRGVCWNPVPKGGTHPGDLDYPGFAATDIELMRAAHVNVVRTYEPLTDRSVLDQLEAAGIFVLNSVYPYGGDAASVVTARVNAVKDHRAILMWLIGNEWNYNGLYVGMNAAESQSRLVEVAALIRAADSKHPIATVYGEVPPKSLVDGMPEIDVWGINVYRGIGFGDLFEAWATTSSKPMFLAEFGADAYNANTRAYDPESQAEATAALLGEIVANASDVGDGVALGGTIFEWADEWWKDADGSATVHDVGGIAPGGGPHPDRTFNEEWWGIVDIDRSPRPAYAELRRIYGGG